MYSLENITQTKREERLLQPDFGEAHSRKMANALGLVGVIILGEDMFLSIIPEGPGMISDAENGGNTVSLKDAVWSFALSSAALYKSVQYCCQFTRSTE